MTNTAPTLWLDLSPLVFNGFSQREIELTHHLATFIIAKDLGPIRFFALTPHGHMAQLSRCAIATLLNHVPAAHKTAPTQNSFDKIRHRFLKATHRLPHQAQLLLMNLLVKTLRLGKRPTSRMIQILTGNTYRSLQQRFFYLLKLPATIHAGDKIVTFSLRANQASEGYFRLAQKKAHLITGLFDTEPFAYPHLNGTVEQLGASEKLLADLIWKTHRILFFSHIDNLHFARACQDRDAPIPATALLHEGDRLHQTQHQNTADGMTPYLLVDLRFLQRPNHSFLLDLCRGLHEKDPSTAPTIVVLGPVPTDVTFAASFDPRLRESLDFFPFLSDEESDRLYQNALMALLLTGDENAPTTLRHALSFGKTILAANTESNKDSSDNLAHLLPKDNLAAWISAITDLIENTSKRTEAQDHITKTFRPRLWDHALAEIWQNLKT